MLLRETVAKYEKAYKDGMFSGATISHKLVLDYVRFLRNSKKIETILDIGCGRGLLLNEFKSHECKVSGVEIVPYLLMHELKDMNVVPGACCDVNRIFTEYKFDLVLYVDVLDHLTNDDEAIRALRAGKCICSGGIILTVNGGSPMQTIIKTEREWEALINISGVADESVVSTKTDKSGTSIIGIW